MAVDLYADYKSSLSSLNCILVMKRLNSQTNAAVSIDVEKSCIKVSHKTGTARFILPDIELSPPTCRGLTYTSTGEVQFSLEVKQTDGSTSGASNQKTTSCQNQMIDTILTYQSRSYCAVCGAKLLRDSCFFTRILPLPSDGWAESADMWFCHNHGDATSPTDTQYHPKAKECFVGETSVLIDSSNIRTGVVKVTKEMMVQCSRCRGQLGNVLPSKGTTAENGSSTYELHQHMLRFMDPYLQDDLHTQTGPWRYTTQTEDFLARYLLEQTQTFTSYRLIVSSKSLQGGQSYCLVWLLDKGACVYTSNDDRLTNTVNRHRTVIPLCKKGIKLLYRCQLDTPPQHESMTEKQSDPVVNVWKKDNTVHDLSLSRPVFLRLVNSLIVSTKSLPLSQRHLNGFHVGFLYYCQGGDNG